MANIFNKYNFIKKKDIHLNLNPIPTNINSFNDFNLIYYRGMALPRVPLDISNSKKIDHLIYSPIEDIIYNNNKNIEKELEIEIKINENESQVNNPKDSIKISSNKDPKKALFLDKEKNEVFKKNKDFIFNMENFNEIPNVKNIIEPIPPQNIISIINDGQYNDKNNKISSAKIYNNINNIILSNINLLPNYNNSRNKIPLIINYNNNIPIYNFNFNIYQNNFVNKDLNNFKKSLNPPSEKNISKPIFSICSDSNNEINELGKKGGKRGRKSLSLNKNYRVHSAGDDDNLLRKIQVHYLSFVVNYVNDVIKSFINIKNPPLFKNLDYKIKKTVNHRFVEKLKSKKISEILQLKVSPKMKIHDESVNKNIYDKVCKICPFMINYLNQSYLSLFKEYYNNINKIFIVNGKIVQLSIKTKTFSDLMIKNYRHKEKLNCIANRFFLNSWKTK